MKTTTLLFLQRKEEREILLAMKKRGFGAGKVNGVGGKVQQGESIQHAAAREAKEEISVVVPEGNLLAVGEIMFYFLEHPDWNIHCHMFVAYLWDGIPQESDEMAPAWYGVDSIPYDNMWVDDKYWLPNVLDGDSIKAEFHFNKEGNSIAAYTIHGIPNHE